ncbi:MAG TPA: hypothetical protein VJI13_04840 [Candidatus Norongarragalinales archaeon]|nr:hypothetical protein [Candidatus Norongarragalinales archaeon]
MKDRAQTAIEYLLLLSGVILFVVIVFLMVKGNVFPKAGETIGGITNDIFKMLGNAGK